LAPLRDRLQDLVVPYQRASVIVHADTRTPRRGAWNVQIFHGLGDKGYTGNATFLQVGRSPKLRTAATMLAHALGSSRSFLEPPAAAKRASRYQQVNAYGKRMADQLESLLDGAEITRFGHPALNDLGPLMPDPAGPLLWVPTWDNRRTMGGPPQSGLSPFAHEVALMAKRLPVLVKYHPLTIRYNQDKAARAELANAGVSLIPANDSPYPHLRGVRGVLTDSSSLGFEAFCLGLPVAIARPKGTNLGGLHAELEERVPVLSPGKPDLIAWAEAPPTPGGRAWARELLDTPTPGLNDAHAKHLRQRVQ